MIFIGIGLGAFFGFFLAAVLGAGKVSDLQSDNIRLNLENARLRERLIKQAVRDIREDDG
jgi:hypothetical protein